MQAPLAMRGHHSEKGNLRELGEERLLGNVSQSILAL